jgi:AAA+ ATPase superfamily predicted ATPase
MRHIEFYNREKETMELTRILSTDPTLITFIYGPINSGKTELITNLIKHLPKSQKVFYINLRGRFISNCDEFIKVLFDVEHAARYERIKEFLKPVVNDTEENRKEKAEEMLGMRIGQIEGLIEDAREFGYKILKV